MLKKFFGIFSAFLIAFQSVCMAQGLPEEGFSRIEWVKQCCGSMPKGLLYCIIAIICLVVITYLYSLYLKRGKRS